MSSHSSTTPAPSLVKSTTAQRTNLRMLPTSAAEKMQSEFLAGRNLMGCAHGILETLIQNGVDEVSQEVLYGLMVLLEQAARPFEAVETLMLQHDFSGREDQSTAVAK